MKRRGFSLMEVLVVMTIIALCVAMTIPYFVEAKRAEGLRVSSQTIIQTAKYARAMSILKQTDMALLVDKGAGQVELVTLTAAPGADDQSKFLDERAERAALAEQAEPSDGSSTNDKPAAPLPVIKTELVRDMEQDIKIKSLTVAGNEGKSGEDVSWIFFNRNGSSSGFTIQIEDSRGSTADIEMDGISGLVTVKMEERHEKEK